MGSNDLLPFALLLLVFSSGVIGAAYLKIGLVLSVLRHAFGAGTGVPPAAVTTALALLLSALVMAPVAERSLRAMDQAALGRDPTPAAVAPFLRASLEPLRQFFRQHTPARERGAMLDLARRVRPLEERAAVGEEDLVVLGPAFALAELRLAFQIAFLLLLPFLVLDLLVASLLQGLALHGLQAAAVALPFKLLLFVLCDGWHLLVRGLILGYT